LEAGLVAEVEGGLEVEVHLDVEVEED